MWNEGMPYYMLCLQLYQEMVTTSEKSHHWQPHYLLYWSYQNKQTKNPTHTLYSVYASGSQPDLTVPISHWQWLEPFLVAWKVEWRCCWHLVGHSPPKIIIEPKMSTVPRLRNPGVYSKVLKFTLHLPSSTVFPFVIIYFSGVSLGVFWSKCI